MTSKIKGQHLALNMVIFDDFGTKNVVVSTFSKLFVSCSESVGALFFKITAFESFFRSNV